MPFSLRAPPPLPGIAKAVAAAAGKEARIVHYDPSKMGLGKGEGFPFRRAQICYLGAICYLKAIQ